MRHFAPRWILKRGEQQKVDSDDAAISSEWIHNEIRIVYGFLWASCVTILFPFTFVTLGKNNEQLKFGILMEKLEEFIKISNPYRE